MADRPATPVFNGPSQTCPAPGFSFLCRYSSGCFLGEYGGASAINTKTLIPMSKSTLRGVTLRMRASLLKPATRRKIISLHLVAKLDVSTFGGVEHLRRS